MTDYDPSQVCDHCSTPVDDTGEVVDGFGGCMDCSSKRRARFAETTPKRASKVRHHQCAPGSSLRVHLRPLPPATEPAACGSYGDRYTDDPDDVTCKKCGPAAKRRSARPLPRCPDCGQLFDPTSVVGCYRCATRKRWEPRQ